MLAAHEASNALWMQQDLLVHPSIHVSRHEISLSWNLYWCMRGLHSFIQSSSLYTSLISCLLTRRNRIDRSFTLKKTWHNVHYDIFSRWIRHNRHKCRELCCRYVCNEILYVEKKHPSHYEIFWFFFTLNKTQSAHVRPRGYIPIYEGSFMLKKLRMYIMNFVHLK